MKKLLLCILVGSLFLGEMNAQEVATMDGQVPDSLLKTFTMEEITVTGARGSMLQQVSEDDVRMLNPSQLSIYKVINMLPSLHQQSVDPYGLADISNYHESFRFRGVEATSGGVPATTANVEELPITGRPGGGASIYDLENFENLTIYTGGIPANKGHGLANVGGKIDMQVQRPGDGLDLQLKQDMGSSDWYRKSYVRVSSGDLPLGVGSFLSYSNTFMDKWKGDGSSTRNNAMFGLTKDFKDKLKVEAFALYNKSKIHTYRSLSYDQISNLSENYELDFSNDPNDLYYYDYNRNEFEDWQFFANIEFKPTASSTLSLKPYYWSDEGYYMETVTLSTGANMVRRWDIEHDVKGVLAQYKYSLFGADFDAGYLYHTQERPGPPTSWKLYAVQNGELVFKKWAVLSNKSNHEMHSPYLATKYRWGNVLVEGGLKYIYYKLPQLITYKTMGIGDVSYEDALATNPEIEDSASTSGSKIEKGLFPNLSLSYLLKSNLTAHVSYGKNYVYHVDIYPYFNSQKSKFYSKGITFQQIWDKKEMEVSHNFELGLRYIAQNWRIDPVIYFSIHKNKQAIFYDEELDATYPQNAADANGYGFEVEAEATPTSAIKCYASFSFNRFYFSENIYNSSGDLIDVEGNQVPDAPKFLLKGFVSYTISKFSFSPILRYTSERYGDIAHEEKIDGAATVDLDITYRDQIFGLKNLGVSLTFMNIFDKEYVSLINTSDYKTLGSSSYQVGAPFTVVASISLDY
ncbi:TonB-dependent receptor [Chloroherpeton thalassium]|nr:TonB-dependent receptor [Chloroherpeton thalassium]